MDYMVLESDDIDKLVKQVNDAIQKKGWEPQSKDKCLLPVMTVRPGSR